MISIPRFIPGTTDSYPVVSNVPMKIPLHQRLNSKFSNHVVGFMGYYEIISGGIPHVGIQIALPTKPAPAWKAHLTRPLLWLSALIVFLMSPQQRDVKESRWKAGDETPYKAIAESICNTNKRGESVFGVGEMSGAVATYSVCQAAT
jgi:hypothetical protein